MKRSLSPEKNFIYILINSIELYICNAKPLPIGKNSIYNFPYCETERLWRRMLLLTPERYNRMEKYYFDECDNVFMKPKRPLFLPLLDNLHKKSDFVQD